MMVKYTTISPRDWGIEKADKDTKKRVKDIMGVSYDKLEERWKKATYQFLLNNYNQDIGAVYGHYNPREQESKSPNLTNLIAPLQFLATYDYYHDIEMLIRAKRSADFVYKNMTIWWPMHMWQGGVKDTGEMDGKVWVKYTAELMLLNIAIFVRTEDEEYLRRARQHATFLKQAQRHNFKFVFDEKKQVWEDNGWKSFGRVIVAYLALYDITSEEKYLERARAWGQYGVELQAPDGCFYLIDNYFYNTDIAADEIRGLAYLYEITGDSVFLQSALRYADWHLEKQRDDGGWLLALDRDGEVVADVVGPGDPANIGISLLYLYEITGDSKYLDAVIKTANYSLKIQAVPGGSYQKYLDDPRVRWGFWSWDPPLDWTLCGDQSVHHVRGLMFLADYLAEKGKKCGTRS